MTNFRLRLQTLYVKELIQLEKFNLKDIVIIIFTQIPN